jgi:glycosyltransferase involved in cell wall biosynthesis
LTLGSLILKNIFIFQLVCDKPAIVEHEMTSSVRVSILIKALNEEATIAHCLAAAIREAHLVSGEIILVDSLSTDRTVEIARTLPIRIVQFEDAVDCCCGAAIQLGYQYALGEYLYLLDGDMELQPGFIALALDYLEANPSIAGVGGLIIDAQIKTIEEVRRMRRYGSISTFKDVHLIGGGGLYRRCAINSVGYIANRWLKACEEAELGVRLKSAGWSLTLLPVPSVTHTGYNESNLEMMHRLWRNGRIGAYGVFLRSALGRPWWWLSVREAWFIFAAPTLHLVTIAFSCLLVNVGVAPYMAVLSQVTLIWGLAFLALWKKKCNVADVVLAIAAWHLYTFAAVPAFLKKVADPRQPIRGREKEHIDK